MVEEYAPVADISSRGDMVVIGRTIAGVRHLSGGPEAFKNVRLAL